MIRFELKKIFSNPVNKIVFAIWGVVLCVVSYLAITDVDYVDENGDKITGAAAAQALREEKKQWAGYLTEDVLVNDYYRADSITKEEVRSFYDRRTANLIEWLNSDDQKNHYSEQEKQFLITQYEELETPFYYEYADGWEALLKHMPSIVMLVVLITGFLVSGIFSDEIQLKADSIFFSAKLGRNKAIAAKIKAGFIVVTSIYWITVLLFSGIVLAILGVDGAGCAIQNGFANWKSFYNLTYLQDYLLSIGCIRASSGSAAAN